MKLNDYQHIDALFTDTVDWELIESYGILGRDDRARHTAQAAKLGIRCDDLRPGYSEAGLL